jgi:hypothetical protein
MRTRPYVGTEEMIDIEEALEEQLRRVEAGCLPTVTMQGLPAVQS